MIKKALVEGGLVAGISAADPRIIAYKGIPFAAPPVGENRWRAPQPVIPWEGEKVCYEFAPISMQATPGLDAENLYTREWNVDPEIPMSEDCLYLNVWTPAHSTEDKLPVFVWYFGGGLQVGNPAEMEFDGERIARRGIVVVSVNYRLNAFGFLAHPELTKEQPDAPSNFGHLDQQAGTRWVKNNIKAFGGDPDNITIGGQSAGGMSVQAQLASPQNEGLFQKAIIMSGIVGAAYRGGFPQRTFEDYEKQGEAFFEFLGVKTLAEARALDAFYIRDKANEFTGFWGTSDDGQFQKGLYNDKILKGDRWHMPVMITRTSTEFTNTISASSMAEFEEKARLYLGEQADDFLKAVGCYLPEAVAKSAVNGMEVAMRTIAEYNELKGLTDPFYYCVFNPEIPGIDHPGTFHSCDLWFFFETLAKCWRPYEGKHYDLARQMCNYWANFIATGDPNGYDANGKPMPEWKPFTKDEPWAMWWNEKPEPKLDKASGAMQAVVKHILEK